MLTVTLAPAPGAKLPLVADKVSHAAVVLAVQSSDTPPLLVSA